VAGTEDHLTPPNVIKAIARKYQADYREYPRHAHYLMREPGWAEIAEDIAQWLEQKVPALTAGSSAMSR
jgi:hypothetical protein